MLLQPSVSKFLYPMIIKFHLYILKLKVYITYIKTTFKYYNIIKVPNNSN